MKLIQIFPDNSKLIFDRGKFDDWCVYLVDNNEARMTPLDKDYFSYLVYLSSKYGNLKVYKDFADIYKVTTDSINNQSLNNICDISKTYNVEDSLTVWKVLTILYAAMIAEENKVETVLRKRIKALGVHQVLFENMSPDEAAQFSKNVDVAHLKPLIEERGIGLFELKV